MEDNEEESKKPIRFIPFSVSSTAYNRLSSLPIESLNTLITCIESNQSHLPEWISPSLLKQIIMKRTSPKNFEGKKDENIISRIYMTRNTETGLEFLLRYSGDTFPFCKWVQEKDILTNQSFPSSLEAFQQEFYNGNDYDLLKEKFGCTIDALSSRTIDEKTVYLFKVSTLNFIAYFWETVKDAKESYSAGVYDYYRRSVEQGYFEPPDDFPKFESESLLKFQNDGVRWIIERWLRKEHCILGDEIGFGKDVQFLSFLKFISKNSEFHGPFMIITSIDRIFKWKSEIEKLTNLYSIIYEGDDDSCSILREFAFPSFDKEGEIIENCLSFNILLISYDLYNRDRELLKNYKWQIVCLENPINIFHSQIELSSFLSDINESYKIFLCDNLIDYGIPQIVNLLNFINPKISWNNSFFSEVYKERTKQLIESVILCRTKEVIKLENDLIKEYAAFVMPSSVQKIMLRLIQLNDISKICKPTDSNIVTNEVLSQNVCNHPFLVEGAEEFLSSKIVSDKKSLLIGSSSKFLALDRIITASITRPIKIAILSQSKVFNSLIEEMLKLNQMNYCVLDNQLNSVDVHRLLKYFNTSNDIFILLSSITINAEDISAVSLVLVIDFNTKSDLAVINMNPFADNSKIQTKFVIKLITFGTLEHEQFVRCRKEREILSEILTQKSENEEEDENEKIDIREIIPPDESTLIEPPIMATFEVDPNGNSNLNEVIKEFQKVAQIVPITSLRAIEKGYSKSLQNNRKINNRDFLSFVDNELKSFNDQKAANPQKAEDSFANNLSYKESEVILTIHLLKKNGYGSWDEISKILSERNSNQIFEFCSIAVILSFRSIPGSLVPDFPVLISQLDMTVPDFTIDLLFCSEPKLWSSIFYSTHSFSKMLSVVRKFKEIIVNESLSLLKVLEMRCVYDVWASNFGHDYFAFNKLPPMRNKANDHFLFNKFRDKTEINPDDENNPRLTEIVNLMKFELIIENKFEITQYFNWWSEGEFTKLLQVFLNFGLNLNDGKSLHAKSGILSKNFQEIKKLSLAIKSAVLTGKNIMPSVIQIQSAPESVQKKFGQAEWCLLKENDFLKIRFVDEFVGSINFVINNLNEMRFDVPANWSLRDFKKVLLLIGQFGVDKFEMILNDPSCGLPNSDSISIFENVTSFSLFILTNKNTFKKSL